MSNTTETILEIDLSALTHNFNYLKQKLNNKTKFLAVVKAFAYGSDMVAVANHLQQLNVDYFAVAYTKEGVLLRDHGITKPILVLHPQPTNFKTLIDRCLEPNLYSLNVLNTFIAEAESLSQNNYPIHIKFNTGLNRLGLRSEDTNTLVNKIKNTNAVKIASLFSHLAASEDDKELKFTLQQINNFNKISNIVKKEIGYMPVLHICNTSGILNYPNAHFNMVRSGIGLYGFGNSSLEDKNLKPIASLKSIISQIHSIQKNETVGYNRAFTATKPLTIATIPIGHADGINRIYGNEKGYVYVNGEKASIIGNVCMDMIMVNITNIKCQEGDEVVIFNGKHKASEMAESAKTISYEIITSISQRVKRIIVES